jgi:hypothetical protein
VRLAIAIACISLGAAAGFARAADAPKPSDAAPAPTPAPMLLAPIGEATRPQLEAAAAAAAKRLKAHGYEGVTARLDVADGVPVVRLDAPSGFPPEMRATIAVLLKPRGAGAEIRYVRNLEGAEAEQWRPPAAPKGTKWVLDASSWSPRIPGAADHYYLVHDAPTVKASETSLATLAPTSQRCFRLAGYAVARVNARPGPYQGTVLVADGVAIAIGDVRVWEDGNAAWIPHDDSRLVDVDAIIRFPMPVGLAPYAAAGLNEAHGDGARAPVAPAAPAGPTVDGIDGPPVK